MTSIQSEPQVRTTVTLRNTNSDKAGTLQLDRFVSWQGTPVGGSFPSVILPEGAVEFTHENGCQPSSMAAVQYSLRDSSALQHAVIVAWDAPTEYDPPNVPNRVYVIGGWKSDMDSMSWQDVLLKLEKSKSSSTDNTYVSAFIEHQTPNSATLQAIIMIHT